jgi:hypothetical protein
MYSFIYSDDDLPYHSTLYCRRSLKSLKCYPWVLLISDTTLAGSTLLLYLHSICISRPYYIYTNIIYQGIISRFIPVR